MDSSTQKPLLLHAKSALNFIPNIIGKIGFDDCLYFADQSHRQVFHNFNAILTKCIEIAQPQDETPSL